MPPTDTELFFWADSQDKLRQLPAEARKDIGFALRKAQQGQFYGNSSAISRYGSGVTEIRVSHDGEAYRTFYVAKFAEAVYVLDALHKKSKSGASLPPKDEARIKQRYRDLVAYRNQQGYS